MSAIQKAMENWGHVAPLLTPPSSEDEYDSLVSALDDVLDSGGADENNPLALLADRMGDLIAEYDNKHYVIEERGLDALKVLMAEKGMKQKDLKGIASQGVVSEILRGQRSLNLNHIIKLSGLFKVPEQVFISHAK